MASVRLVCGPCEARVWLVCGSREARVWLGAGRVWAPVWPVMPGGCPMRSESASADCPAAAFGHMSLYHSWLFSQCFKLSLLYSLMMSVISGL